MPLSFIILIFMVSNYFLERIKSKNILQLKNNIKVRKIISSRPAGNDAVTAYRVLEDESIARDRQIYYRAFVVIRPTVYVQHVRDTY